MKKFSTFSAIIFCCALAGCTAQAKRAQVDRLDTQAKVAQMLREAEAGDVKAQERACSESIGNKLYKPADGGDSWCEKAAAQGSILAMLDLTARYDLGYDRPIDDKKAQYWLKRAAATPPKKDDFIEQSWSSDAYAKLAETYQYGLMGVKPDQRQAAKWHLKAAKAFHPPSFMELGRMYEGGMGVKQDFRQAAKWYRDAARIGGWEGAHALAMLYLKGLGVPRDLEEAYFWDRLSDRLREKEKAERPDAVYVSLIAMDRIPFERQLEIDKRVSEWKPDFSGFF
jgi:TPR repeat protein